MTDHLKLAQDYMARASNPSPMEDLHVLESRATAHAMVSIAESLSRMVEILEEDA